MEPRRRWIFILLSPILVLSFYSVVSSRSLGRQGSAAIPGCTIASICSTPMPATAETRTPSPYLITTPQPTPRISPLPTRRPTATPRPASTPHPIAAAPFRPSIFKGLLVGTGLLRRQMLHLVNADRRATHLLPLILDPALTRVALRHSIDMALHHYLGHVGLDGKTPFDRISRAHIIFLEAGENIGTDHGGPLASQLTAIEHAMMLSPEHRANLLRPGFQKVGIGFVMYFGTLLVTEDFKR